MAFVTPTLITKSATLMAEIVALTMQTAVIVWASWETAFAKRLENQLFVHVSRWSHTIRLFSSAG